MSRFNSTGIDPRDGISTVNIAYGWDHVPPYKPGYFIQVYSSKPEDIKKDPEGNGMIFEEGFIEGMTLARLSALLKLYKSVAEPKR